MIIPNDDGSSFIIIFHYWAAPSLNKVGILWDTEYSSHASVRKTQKSALKIESRHFTGPQNCRFILSKDRELFFFTRTEC